MLSTLKLCLRLTGHVWRGRRIIKRHFVHFTAAQRADAIRSWSQQMLRLTDIELRVIDKRTVEDRYAGALLVCNHISWLDIFVMDAWQAATFVSKHEVAHWPLIGPLVTGAGTLYIERAKRRDAHKMVSVIADAMQEGRRVAIFPEGTTSDGMGLLHFHANLLQSAVSSGMPVQPLVLRFLDSRTGERTRDAAYIGDMTLLQSLQLLAKYASAHEGAHIIAELTLLPTQRGTERRALCASLRDAMADALGVKEEDPLLPHHHQSTDHSNVTT